MKKKIYWCLPQLNDIGGTEMVTLQIIKMLEEEYEIHIVLFDHVDFDKVSYNLPESVIIEDIGFPPEIIQLDLNFNRKIENKQFLKAINLKLYCAYFYLFKRFKIRKKLLEISSKDDIFVFPSFELMCFAPRGRHIVQHFHFNSKLYNNLFSHVDRLLARKPDSFIFLSESTYKAINKRNKINGTIIHNPSRYLRKKNFEYHNNTLMTACRLEHQKNPLLLVKIANELKKMDFPYVFNIYGDGSYKGLMERYIKEHDLSNVHIYSGLNDLEDAYSNADLYLITSYFEGFPLSVIEANSFSIPAIWKEMGDPTNSVILEGINGYVIDSNNPKEFAKRIMEVFSDKDKLKSLKESTYEFSKRYEENEIRKDWQNFFAKEFDSLDK